MPTTPKIVPISDLRQNASEVVRAFVVQTTCLHNPRGRAAAVNGEHEVYEDSQHELDILRLLARGEKEIEAGIAMNLKMF